MLDPITQLSVMWEGGGFRWVEVAWSDGIYWCCSVSLYLKRFGG